MSRATAASACGALVLGLAAAVTTPAQAQQQIAVGQAMSGSLTVSDLQWTSGERYDPYIFYGQAGQFVTITMSSSDFDSYLILQDMNGNQLAYNDDGGGGLNAQIQQTLPMTGTYRIIARAYRANAFGNYTLMLAGQGGVAMTPTPMAAPMAITTPNQLNTLGQIGANQQVSGNLTPMDQRWDSKPIQVWAFPCNAGQPFQVDILSTWDNYALVFDPLGTTVARDDDTGEGLNARINYTCTVTGVYRLGVTTFTSSTTPGAYTLQVQSTAMAMAPQPMPMAAAPTAIPMAGNTMPAPAPQSMAITGGIPSPGQIGQLAVGQNVQGRLETGDQQMNDGTWADVWQFNGMQGQTVTIELRSEEFDTYAQLLDGTGARLAEDDDSLGDLDSRITFTLPRTGMYQVVVNNFSDERRAGVYTLSLR
jgi:hypothetical protein